MFRTNTHEELIPSKPDNTPIRIVHTVRHPPAQQIGLDHWMQRVLTELDSASASLAPDPVHDLRVAIRRCRSIAEGFTGIDSDRTWKKMRKAGKQIFVPLGRLRDSQVMIDWLNKLGSPDDPATKDLSAKLAKEEQELKISAFTALGNFDRKQWKSWIEVLSKRSRRVEIGGPAFEYMALERWHIAYALHQKALKNRSKVAYHSSRIGLKKFRYIVELFLPALYREWAADLKEMQDLLGEVHDLDVLWDMALKSGIVVDPDVRSRWQTKIAREREQRIARYRQKMVGKTSLWKVWRQALPSGKQREQALLAKFKIWAWSFDGDREHSRNVARIALQLHDGFVKKRILRFAHANSRGLLHAAALAHEVGRSETRKSYQKVSGRLIGQVATPVGWDSEDVHILAAVTRYHRGALPRRSRDGLSQMSSQNQITCVQLAGILRLADALESCCQGKPTRVSVEKTSETALVYAAGYNAHSRLAEKVAAARHLLEVSCRAPIVIRAWSNR